MSGINIEPQRQPSNFSLESVEKKDDLEKVGTAPVTLASSAQPSGSDAVEAAAEYTEEQYRRLLRKQDLILLPIMWLCYGTQQADKTSVSTQATFGLRTDLHMHGQQYAWLTTVFYLCYLVCEMPANYMMQRLAINTTLGTMMVLWGIIVTCIAASQNWATTMALRALQGAFECTISPAFLIITASWWRTEEHSFRALIWGTSNAGMGVITSLGMYGISKHAQRVGGLAPWRCISLFLGPMTICLGLIAFFCLGTPREVKFLSQEEKRMAAARIVANNTGSDRTKRPWSWPQFRSTWRCPQTYIFFFIVIVNSMPNGGTTAFGNLIYVSFGYNALDTLVKGIVPQKLLSMAWFLTVGYITRRWRKLRFIMMMFSVVPAFVGMLCISLLPASPSYRWTKWGLYLITVTGDLPGLMIWSMLPSNVAGRTKKSVTSSVLFIAYCVGNSIGAQLFQAKWAPRYTPAIILCAVFYGLEFCMMGCWRFYYIAMNRKRRAAFAAEGLSEEEVAIRAQKNAEADVPDHENPYFIYDI